MRDISLIQSEVDDLEKQILALTQNLDQKKSELQQATKEASETALKRIVDELNGLGFSREELAKALGLAVKPNFNALQKKRGDRGGTEPKAKGVPKYRNSADPSLTWTGKGRKPGWVALYIENGGELDSLLIKE